MIEVLVCTRCPWLASQHGAMPSACWPSAVRWLSALRRSPARLVGPEARDQAGAAYLRACEARPPAVVSVVSERARRFLHGRRRLPARSPAHGVPCPYRRSLVGHVLREHAQPGPTRGGLNARYISTVAPVLRAAIPIILTRLCRCPARSDGGRPHARARDWRSRASVTPARPRPLRPPHPAAAV